MKVLQLVAWQLEDVAALIAYQTLLCDGRSTAGAAGTAAVVADSSRGCCDTEAVDFAGHNAAATAAKTDRLQA